MSHGFVVKSDEDKVLVHSEAENLFFVCKKVLDSTHTWGISFDANASTHVGDTSAEYRTNSIFVKMPRSYPNTDSLAFFPFVDTLVFTFGAFSLQNVEHEWHHHTATHTVFRVTITALTNTSFNPTIYLFANSPEVVEYHDTEEVNEYGVEVFKGSGTPYKVYDSTKTPLVVTYTALKQPHSRVHVGYGKSNLKVSPLYDQPVAAISSKRTLMYCPMQADGGEYKSYEEDIEIDDCYTSEKIGIDVGEGWFRVSATETVCLTSRRRATVYGFYAYYKAVFKVEEGEIRLTYLPVMFKSAVKSEDYSKELKVDGLSHIAIALTSMASAPTALLTGGIDAAFDTMSPIFTSWRQWMFPSTGVPDVFLADTLNKTRNSDHDYLVLFADKSLYD